MGSCNFTPPSLAHVDLNIELCVCKQTDVIIAHTSNFFKLYMPISKRRHRRGLQNPFLRLKMDHFLLDSRDWLFFESILIQQNIVSCFVLPLKIGI